MINYFKLLGLEERFDLSNSLISQQYFATQKLHHPDRLSGNMPISMALNEAYSNLIDPLSRAQHLFELNGIEITTNLISLSLLSKIMDKNSSLESSLKRMTNAFKEEDLKEAYEAWCECQYLKRRRT